MEPTRPRRRSLKSRGSVSSVIVSTASKGSGGGGVGGGIECWRRRRCYHDLQATVKSHEFHNPRGLGFCGYPSSTRSGTMTIGMQPSILVNRTQRGMRIMLRPEWMKRRTTVHETGDGKEPQAWKFWPQTKSSANFCPAPSSSVFPGCHPLLHKSTFFHVQVCFTSPRANAMIRGLTFIINFCFQTKDHALPSDHQLACRALSR